MILQLPNAWNKKVPPQKRYHFLELLREERRDDTFVGAAEECGRSLLCTKKVFSVSEKTLELLREERRDDAFVGVAEECGRCSLCTKKVFSVSEKTLELLSGLEPPTSSLPTP